MLSWIFRAPNVVDLTAQREFSKLARACIYRKDASVRVAAVRSLANLINGELARINKNAADSGDFGFLVHQEAIRHYFHFAYGTPMPQAEERPEPVAELLKMSMRNLHLDALRTIVQVLNSDHMPEVVETAAQALGQIETAVASLRYFTSESGIVSIGVTPELRRLKWRARVRLKPDQLEDLTDEILRLLSSPSSEAHSQLREIGLSLFRGGGMSQMNMVWYRVEYKTGASQMHGSLTSAWNGIGDWRD